MTYQRVKEKLIKVYSLSLLKKLAESRCTSSLRVVKLMEETQKPVFLFKDRDSVNFVVDDFIKSGGINSAGYDDPKLWEGFSPDLIKQYTEDDKERYVFVAQYHVTENMFKNDLMCYLAKTYFDHDNKQRIYVFVRNDKVNKVIAER